MSATNASDISIIRQTLYSFVQTFVVRPYLCYTEHGLHALFFTELYANLPPDRRYTSWQQQDVCVLQKEYPTASPLGKSKRQHWDIAIIKTPLQSMALRQPSYDYLRLLAVIEFGLNEPLSHVQDDIARLSHGEANIDHCFVVQLYRLSTAGARISDRDWSPNTQLPNKETIALLTLTTSVEVLYGLSDSTGTYPNGVWHIAGGQIRALDTDKI